MTDRDRGEELRITPNVTPDVGMPDRGFAGGMAPAAVAWPTMAVDRIRWSAVWAGLLVAVALQLILSAFGVGANLYGFAARAGGAVGASNAGNVALWTAIWGLISLFVGGFVAARLAASPTAANGIWHGVVVWALALVLGTFLTALGITGVLGYMNISPGIAASDVTRTAWGFFVGALLGVVFAALGGWAGKKETLNPEAPTR